MVGRGYKESDVDFEAIGEEMGKLVPPRLSVEDVLARLRDKMVVQRKKGVSLDQMCEVLTRRGIDVGVRQLKSYLEKGEMPGARKQARGREETAPRGGSASSERQGADGAERV